MIKVFLNILLFVSAYISGIFFKEYALGAVILTFMLLSLKLDVILDKIKE